MITFLYNNCAVDREGDGRSIVMKTEKEEKPPSPKAASLLRQYFSGNGCS